MNGHHVPGRRRRSSHAGLRLAHCALLCYASTAYATDFTVKTDGTGTFSSIQACSDAARGGDTCTVYAGVYNERVRTVNGGTADDNRVTFRAIGKVTMQGFEIRHPYVTVQGFDITGYTVQHQGLITVRYGGDNCELLDNTVRDSAAAVYGIYFYLKTTDAASNCVVRNNRLSNLGYHFLTVNGANHLFEKNTFEYQNNMDYIRLFGLKHVFRRNIFWRGTVQSGSGNHPDFVQTWGGASTASQDHLFEENWIENLPSQFAQINSGAGSGEAVLHDNVKNITFKRNVIVNLSLNANVYMPGVRFENNTFFRLASQLSGIIFTGTLKRGDASSGSLRSNVFLAGGARSSLVDDASGYYMLQGALLSEEVIAHFVAKETDNAGNVIKGPICLALFEELKTNGYIDGNGKILAKARALSNVSQLLLSTQYLGYKIPLYEHLLKTVRLDDSIRSTFDADYNFVAGAPESGFPKKRSSGCVTAATYTDWNFCEPHGINGGDPKFADVTNPLGPDGIPFTLDDGLKPLPTSPLCGKAADGNDIGAYSCDPNKVFPADLLPPGNFRAVPNG